MAGNINQCRWGTSAKNSSFSFLPYPQTSFASTSWIENHELAAPESWSQLLLGGLQEGQINNYSEFQAKKIENWGRQVLYPPLGLQMTKLPQEISLNGYERNQQFQIDGCRWSQTIPSPSPSPCSTNPTRNLNNFSSNKSPRSQQQSDYSSKCNSTHTGALLKKARIQSPQTTFKVRKEKLGNRITALQQLVSPFGKTDTASVLLEAITHIKFLQNQIEALSSPYLGVGASNPRNIFQGERKCVFPDDPGQLLNDVTIQKREVTIQEKEEEEPKDLRSRGLCLVPLSCTISVGKDDCTDYWAPTFGRGF